MQIFFFTNKYTEDYCEKEEHINTLGSMFDLNALMAAIA